ncbi:MAG: VCBS repeat-containing protein [Phycisphaerae bacterium]
MPTCILISLALLAPLAALSPAGRAGDDCDNDGYINADEILAGAPDCNQNGIPDECDLITQPLAFLAETSIPTGAAPIGVAAADFDLDGDADLAVANELDDNVWILYNDGRGGFSTPHVIEPLAGFPSTNPTTFAVGDWDRDGDADLAVAYTVTGDVGILDNRGGELVFAARVLVGGLLQSIQIADFDRDGDPDMVIHRNRPDGLRVLLNDGGGGFSIGADVPLTMAIDGFTIADFTDDGAPDVLVAGYDRFRVFRNAGDATFVDAGDGGLPVHPTPYGQRLLPLASDVDDDGRAELIVLRTEWARRVFLAMAYVYRCTGRGTFETPGQTIPLLMMFTPSAVIRDVDHDGVKDIIAIADGGVFVLPGLGGAQFGAPAFSRGSSPASGSAVADFDLDGKYDVAASDRWMGRVVIQWGTPTTPLSADCNVNGIPDECDIAGGTSVDTDGNGVPDECEGAGNSSDQDSNTNANTNSYENENNNASDSDASSGDPAGDSTWSNSAADAVGSGVVARWLCPAAATLMIVLAGAGGLRLTARRPPPLP